MLSEAASSDGSICRQEPRSCLLAALLAGFTVCDPSWTCPCQLWCSEAQAAAKHENQTCDLVWALQTFPRGCCFVCPWEGSCLLGGRVPSEWGSGTTACVQRLKSRVNSSLWASGWRSGLVLCKSVEITGSL